MTDDDTPTTGDALDALDSINANLESAESRVAESIDSAYEIATVVEDVDKSVDEARTALQQAEAALDELTGNSLGTSHGIADQTGEALEQANIELRRDVEDGLNTIAEVLDQVHASGDGGRGEVEVGGQRYRVVLEPIAEPAEAEQEASE